MPGNPFRSIQGKLVGLYLLLTVVALATLTGLFYQTTEGLLSAAIRSHLQTIAEAKGELISRWMAEREHDVEVLTKNVGIRRFLTLPAEQRTDQSSEDHKELTSLLRLVRDQYEAYHEISIIVLDGTSLVSTSDAPVAALTQSPLLKNLRQGRRFISETHPHGGGLGIDVAVPVSTSGGDVLGAVVAVADVGVINQMTDGMRLMESGEAYLVDRRGIFLTHRDRRRVFRDDISTVFGIAKVISGNNGVDEYVDYRGVEVLGAFQWFPRWQWGLIAEVDRDEAFAPIYVMRRFLFLVVALIAAVLLFGSLLIARRIVRPLRELTHAVQAVASGKMDHRLDVEGRDEVGTLSESFNIMTQTLERSQAQMDERIARATKRLEQKNEELERANQSLAGINTELSVANDALEEQRALVVQSARLATFGEMAAGIAHEINNPLTTMKNLIHSLSAGLREGDIRKKDMGIVAEEIDKISKLVRNFLTYARPAKGTVSAIDVGAMVDKCITLITPQARRKSLALESTLDADAPNVQGDREQLEQVMLNLLLNAIQASPDDSHLRIFTRTLVAGRDGAADAVEVGITDQGEGIARGDRAEIFKPFFTTKSRGSGLGLAISQRIVEEHGGAIHFASAEGQGSTFTVTLPTVGGSSGDADTHRG